MNLVSQRYLHTPLETGLDPPDSQKKFDLLIKRVAGGLVVARLNINKTGSANQKELATILSNLKIHCLAVVEHHISAGDYVEDKNSTVKDCPSLKISEYNSASKHRDQSSGGVAWYWKRSLNVRLAQLVEKKRSSGPNSK